jgi:hypothetical protein
VLKPHGDRVDRHAKPRLSGCVAVSLTVASTGTSAPPCALHGGFAEDGASPIGLHRRPGGPIHCVSCLALPGECKGGANRPFSAHARPRPRGKCGQLPTTNRGGRDDGRCDTRITLRRQPPAPEHAEKRRISCGVLGPRRRPVQVACGRPPNRDQVRRTGVLRR